MNRLTEFSPISRAVIVATAIGITVTFLRAAASIIAPVLLAAFIAIIATPALRWLQRRRVPKWLSLAVIVFVLFEAGSILVLGFTGQLEGFREGLPGYHQRLILLSDQFGGWLENIGVDNARKAVKDIFDPASFNIDISQTDVNFAAFRYFSFVTITTLGYGDITPVTEVAKAFTVLEAVVGQLYLVVAVAWLVGMHVASRPR